jgi:hypothetical protein
VRITRRGFVVAGAAASSPGLLGAASRDRPRLITDRPVPAATARRFDVVALDPRRMMDPAFVAALPTGRYHVALSPANLFLLRETLRDRGVAMTGTAGFDLS